MLIGKYEEKCCHHSTGKIPSWSLVAHSKVRTQDGWLVEELQVDFNLPSSQLLNYFFNCALPASLLDFLSWFTGTIDTFVIF